MSKAVHAVHGLPELPDDRRFGHAAEAALDRLGAASAHRRCRADRKVAGAFRRHREAQDVLNDAEAGAEEARGDELAARADAAHSHDTAHPEDGGRRGLSTTAYGLLLLILWAVNLPIAVATFQVFGESLVFTVLLAFLADAVFLLIAEAAGVSLRRAHLSHDAGTALGAELSLSWSLLVLGLAGALASGWVRWSYLEATGTGFGFGGVLFTTILALATFLLAVLAAWRHHHPAVARAERAARRRRRAGKRVASARRRVRRTGEACSRRAIRRRHLAQRLVGRADRRLRHAHAAAARAGGTVTVHDPAWLVHERLLARMPVPGGLLQPLDTEPGASRPPMAAMPGGDEPKQAS
jgi:hypothetical protein